MYRKYRLDLYRDPVRLSGREGGDAMRLASNVKHWPVVRQNWVREQIRARIEREARKRRYA